MIRGLWSRETVALMLLIAYLPLAATWMSYGGPAALARLALAVLVLAVWHLVFMLARAQPPSLAAGITALAIAMLAPEDLGAFRLVLGISFGAVIGELIFGGWGRNVVNPATVALSFLGFGFPASAWPEFVTPIAWAVIPAAIIGVATGTMSARVIASALLVLVGASFAGVLSDEVLYPAGIVIVLLIADPVTSAATALGRWLNGAIYSGLVTIFAVGWNGAAPVQIAVAAALLTSLTAPLLDEAALALWLARRRKRHVPQ